MALSLLVIGASPSLTPAPEPAPLIEGTRLDGDTFLSPRAEAVLSSGGDVDLLAAVREQHLAALTASPASQVDPPRNATPLWPGAAAVVVVDDAQRAGADLIALYEDGRVRALHGPSGTELWTDQHPGWEAAWVGGDVTGDQREDLVLFVVGEPREIASGDVRRTEVDQTLRAVSGADGATIWERTDTLVVEVQESMVELPVVGELARRSTVRMTDFAFADVLDRGPDATLFVDLYDVEWEILDVGAERRSTLLVASEDAMFLDGQTGTQRISITTTSVNDLPYAEPFADLDGDGRGEMIVYELPQHVDGERPGITAYRGISAYSGADGSHLWSYSPPEAYAPLVSGAGYNPGDGYPMALDGDGDGLRDVLIVGYRRIPNALTLLSGATGRELWRREFPDDGHSRDVSVAGDIDGDGGEDVLRYMFRLTCPPTGGDCSQVTDVEALSGTDGRALWRTSTPSLTLYTLHAASGRILGDLDGDGTGDLPFARRNESTGMFEIGAFRGSDGGTLWDGLVHPDNTALFAPLPIGADFDGDGGEDLAGVTPQTDPLLGQGTGENVTVVWSGRDGRELWRGAPQQPGQPRPVSGRRFAAVLTTGILPAPGCDLAAATGPSTQTSCGGITAGPVQLVEPLQATLGGPSVAVYGSTGEVLWQA